MSKQSGGILLFRRKDDVEVLLVHLGGPLWAKKDVWSIPKGELDEGEDHLTAAKREFKEELGIEPPEGEWLDLGTTKGSDSKVNYIWAVEYDVDVEELQLASTFTMEWPPKSGKKQAFPENDRAGWFKLAAAKQKLFKAQMPFIDRLAEILGTEIGEADVPQQSLF